MIEGLEGFAPLHYAHAFCSRVLRRLGVYKSTESKEDQGLDRIAEFDEYPRCELCGSAANHEHMVCIEGSRIVKCDECGLLFTSPRIAEERWMQWLRQDSERSRLFTEARLKYGVALPVNIKYVYPNWRKTRDAFYRETVLQLKPYIKGELRRLHDVGCGVGALLLVGREMGLDVSGNDMNAYACKVMTERLGLRVFNKPIAEVDLAPGSLDALTMCDFIEHSYHPMADLKAAFNLLREGGGISVETFHVDCKTYHDLGPQWSMLFWNHTYHFTEQTLCGMMERAGFKVQKTFCNYESPDIRVLAVKP